ncbi:pentatricopeptide repeat-containing protein At1g33350-like [Phalaenopsis equestris]|uniref:pentatricopeptide repeat-containing protein At1g33350-like n=1 Tax=Phalaenopsis equestris TaxID=78828 RepID=UPI0009E25741|nr:pentatricopeptide repeat-containing protein At1g33350-like [Phalaenopsis equestris]
MFAKCGDIISARKFFDPLIEKDVLPWTSIISGYVQAGLPRTALDLFENMLNANVLPNKITIITILSACASIGSLSAAEKIIAHMDARWIKSDLKIQTSLIHMYCSCGSLERAEEIFNTLSHKDLTAWSSMINCYAFNGKGEQALALFKEMLKDRNIEPDAVVFTDVLSACSHSGLVEVGLNFFTSMQQEYGMEPSKEHYSCVVDLLSRAGHFDSSLEFIRRVPMELRSHLWSPFLSALRTIGGVHQENILPKKPEVENEGTGNQLLLAGICASLGKWKEARDFRILIDKRGSTKEAGLSRTEFYA